MRPFFLRQNLSDEVPETFAQKHFLKLSAQHDVLAKPGAEIKQRAKSQRSTNQYIYIYKQIYIYIWASHLSCPYSVPIQIIYIYTQELTKYKIANQYIQANMYIYIYIYVYGPPI